MSFLLDSLRERARHAPKSVALEDAGGRVMSSIDLVAALEAPDEALVGKLEPLIDLDALYRYWAAETLIWHRDGFSGNINNHYWYANPDKGGRFTLMPWGIDSALNPNSAAGLPDSVMSYSLLTSRLYFIPAQRDRYYAALDDLLAKAWDPAQVVRPVAGRPVALKDVPDATFAQGLVGYGLAIDPPREVVDAVAPVAGSVMKLWPHAYVVLTDDQVGVLVHLGIDTVQLNGEGFTTHVAEGDRVEVGQKVITYDVPAVEATGRNPIIPVLVMERQADGVAFTDAVIGDHVAALDALFSTR